MPEKLSNADTTKFGCLPGDPFIYRHVKTIAGIVTFLILIGSHAAGLCLTLGQSVEPDADACRHSDQIYTSDAMLMRTLKAPTHFRLMNSRYVAMVQAVRGYHCTGTVAVGFDGHHFLQTGRSDDPGIMELIPTLSLLTGMPLAGAYDVTIIGTILWGVFVGYAGFWKLHTGGQLRWVGAATFIFIGLAEARVADEYIFQICPLIAGIPWLFYFAITRRSLALTASATLLAFCCAWCSLIRTGTIVICMTFLVAMFLLRYRIQKPFLPFLLLALVCVPPYMFEQSLIARRNLALARMGATPTSQDRRPLWHTAYIGLGFIPNSEVSEYKDEVAGSKVRSIDPAVAYTSAQYETILRREVWRILKRKPMIVIQNLAAKASIVALLGLFLLFPSRRLIFAEREVRWLDIAVIVTMGMSAMNAIVAVPRSSYLLTFSCLGLLYSSLKICRARSLVKLERA